MAETLIEERLAATLSGVEGLNGRVFPMSAKKGTPLPFCVYISTGEQKDDSLGGWMESKWAFVEINLLHTSYREMKRLAERVVERLEAIDYATVYIEPHKPEMYEEEIEAYRKIIGAKFTF